MFERRGNIPFRKLFMRISPRLTLVVLLLAALPALGAIIVEPDNYAAGTDLTHAIPQVSLWTAISADNQQTIPSWYISAVSDGYASTGHNVFGYLAFPSLWDARRMR